MAPKRPTAGLFRAALQKGTLPTSHPTAVAFFDESGAIAHDRFFSVGCLKLVEPSILLRAIEKWRDQRHWYKEIHFANLTRGALPLYREVIDIISNSADAQFSCFVADRQVADPLARYGSPWEAYEKLASQLLIGSIRPREIVTVIADTYSTPDNVVFEQVVREDVNTRLGRLAVASVVRIDSESATALQVVDLLTSAVTFEFRQNAGIAGATTPKAQLAAYLRQRFGVQSFLQGCRNRMNVAVYDGGRASRSAMPTKPA